MTSDLTTLMKQFSAPTHPQALAAARGLLHAPMNILASAAAISNPLQLFSPYGAC